MFKPEPIPVEVINVLALLGGMTELIGLRSALVAQFIGKLAQDLSKRRTKNRIEATR